MEEAAQIQQEKEEMEVKKKESLKRQKLASLK
jgi:hypothetical protein